MSSQVLARKWRPRNFGTLVGQEHVVRALRHALDERRLHHAWLFTGTRGVGKTTLSRILAKSLNCIGPDGTGGITSTPCGACRPCVDIDAGRFVDYIEMDAASNRGVDEMAQLLEQAVYAPANARFKVYMIDEVHMLTSHAFNAMLKTLEEPPEHVKFILATTDPQKIPVTVLSRCLQFNLKQMPIPDIVGHLAFVLGEEGIPFERGALPLLARAAAGSMRDALSLTDQAIAYSAGDVGEDTVRGMLGALDQTYLLRILDALADGDGSALMTVVDEIAARSLSFAGALQEMGALLHRIAVLQTVPDAATGDGIDADERHLKSLAERLSPEDVQLYYQVAAHGRRDLGLAPDEATGFSMTLLRMLAFRIDDGAGDVAAGAASKPSRSTATVPSLPATTTMRGAAVSGPDRSAAQDDIVAKSTTAPSRPGAIATTDASTTSAPTLNAPTTSAPTTSAPTTNTATTVAPATIAPTTVAPATVAPATDAAAPSVIALSTPSTAAAVPPPLVIDDWVAVVGALKLSGFARELAQQTELVSHDDRSVALRVPNKALLTSGALDKFRNALAQHFGRPVAVAIEVGAVRGATVAAARSGERAARQADAQAIIAADPFVQAVVRDFGGATVVPGSVKPV